MWLINKRESRVMDSISGKIQNHSNPITAISPQKTLVRIGMKTTRKANV